MHVGRRTLAVVILWLTGSVWGATGITTDNREADKLPMHVDRGKGRIAPEIHGHFAEHLGHCIYTGFCGGENSNIPDVWGVRADVVEVLQKIQASLLRWPGGSFPDEYHWKEGIGPRDERGRRTHAYWAASPTTIRSAPMNSWISVKCSVAELTSPAMQVPTLLCDAAVGGKVDRVVIPGEYIVVLAVK